MYRENTKDFFFKYTLYKLLVNQNKVPKYSTREYPWHFNDFASSSQWTTKRWTMGYRIRPDKLRLWDRQKLSMKIILQFRPKPRNRISRQAKHTGTHVPGPLQNRTSGLIRNTSTRQLKIALAVENNVENQDCPTSRLLGISCDRKIQDRLNSVLERLWLITSVFARTKWSGRYFLGSKCLIKFNNSDVWPPVKRLRFARKRK